MAAVIAALTGFVVGYAGAMWIAGTYRKPAPKPLKTKRWPGAVRRRREER